MYLNLDGGGINIMSLININITQFIPTTNLTDRQWNRLLTSMSWVVSFLCIAFFWFRLFYYIPADNNETANIILSGMVSVILAIITMLLIIALYCGMRFWWEWVMDAG